MLLIRLNLGKLQRFHTQTHLRCSKSPKDLANKIINTEHVKRTESKSEEDPAKIATDVIKSFPEEPTTCCMTGCANCVWLDYVEKLSEYYKDGGDKAVKDIQEKISDESLKAFLLHEIRMRKKS